MKVIAFYLPQFHQIPENDKWWGKGYTEWTNTKKGKPLFPGHYQPREPFKNNYYDLTDPTARKWQANIAKQYGIYGFCYYHYWFKGKRLLEKPFNEVLKTGEPDFPFCLSWANHDWVKIRPSGHTVIMPQEYGDKEEWEKHFNYLLKAFQDDRYIRVDDKPLFVIYAPEKIPRCEEMLTYWNALSKRNGLKGIYFVQSLLYDFGFPNKVKVKGFNAKVEVEPMYTIKRRDSKGNYKKIKGFGKEVEVVDYDKVWSSILNRASSRRENIIPGAFMDWDNSARRKYNRTIFKGANPKKFSRYLTELINRAKINYKSDFLFINAWNEWSEGTYLEPDKKYGFQYLEAVKKALEANGF